MDVLLALLGLGTLMIKGGVGFPQILFQAFSTYQSTVGSLGSASRRGHSTKLFGSDFSIHHFLHFCRSRHYIPLARCHRRDVFRGKAALYFRRSWGAWTRVLKFIHIGSLLYPFTCPLVFLEAFLGRAGGDERRKNRAHSANTNHVSKRVKAAINSLYPIHSICQFPRKRQI